jgi:nucleoside-diphosphate-sugar epimerase
VALIAVVTGIVGNSLAAKLLQEPKSPESSSWKVYGVACRSAKSDRLPESLHHIGCNLLHREETLSKLSRQQDVTHLVTWVNRLTEEKNITTNTQLYRNILDALLPNAKNFQHKVLQTGTKHYLGPFELPGQVPVPDPLFREDYPRPPCENFYHDLEDIDIRDSEGDILFFSF